MQEVLKFKKIITSDHLQRPFKSKPLIILEDDEFYFYVSYQPYNSLIKLPEYSVYINLDNLKKPKNVLSNNCVIDTTKLYVIKKSDFLNYYKEDKYLKIEDLYLTKQLQIFYNLSKNLNQQELLKNIKNRINEKITETTDLIYQLENKKINKEKEEY